MKALLLMLVLIPTFSSATTLHLAEILSKGFHFSAVKYSAFDEPESARGKDTEDYLAAILKNASDNINANYVSLRDLAPEASINSNYSLSTTFVTQEERKNSLNLSELKKCAIKALPLIKSTLFHANLNQVELKAQIDSLISEERGHVMGHQVGIVCGIHMGEYGEILEENLIEEFKLMSFFANESESSFLRLLKVMKFQKESRTVVGIKFFNYLRTAFQVHSFLGRFSNLDIHYIKNDFIDKFLSDSSEDLGSGATLEVNNSHQRAELEEIFKKVQNEII